MRPTTAVLLALPALGLAAPTRVPRDMRAAVMPSGCNTQVICKGNVAYCKSDSGNPWKIRNGAGLCSIPEPSPSRRRRDINADETVEDDEADEGEEPLRRRAGGDPIPAANPSAATTTSNSHRISAVSRRSAPSAPRTHPRSFGRRRLRRDISVDESVVDDEADEGEEPLRRRASGVVPAGTDGDRKQVPMAIERRAHARAFPSSDKARRDISVDEDVVDDEADEGEEPLRRRSSGVVGQPIAARSNERNHPRAWARRT